MSKVSRVVCVLLGIPTVLQYIGALYYNFMGETDLQAQHEYLFIQYALFFIVMTIMLWLVDINKEY